MPDISCNCAKVSVKHPSAQPPPPPPPPTTLSIHDIGTSSRYVTVILNTRLLTPTTGVRCWFRCGSARTSARRSCLPYYSRTITFSWTHQVRLKLNLKEGSLACFAWHRLSVFSIDLRSRSKSLSFPPPIPRGAPVGSQSSLETAGFS